MLEIGCILNQIMKQQVSYLCPDAGRFGDWDRLDKIGQNDKEQVFDPGRDVEKGAKGEGGTRRGKEEKWMRWTPMQVF